MSETIEVLTTDLSQPEKYFHNFNNSPVEVDMKEVLGVVFMGLLSLILLILYVRSNQRNQELIAQINRSHAGE